MPDWLQNIAQFIPLTYFSTSLRDVMIKSASFKDVSHDILAMVIWAIVLIGLATFTFNFGDKD
jgi:ABC-2 type transport system permease protein